MPNAHAWHRDNGEKSTKRAWIEESNLGVNKQ